VSVSDDSGNLPVDTVTALSVLAANPTVEPSGITLRNHIEELEMDLRNTEFRLQYLFHQRHSILNLLGTAKVQAGNRSS
jgi:hypothetical protein